VYKNWEAVAERKGDKSDRVKLKTGMKKTAGEKGEREGEGGGVK